MPAKAADRSRQVRAYRTPVVASLFVSHRMRRDVTLEWRHCGVSREAAAHQKERRCAVPL